jgi:hypothetical protein
MAIGDYDSQLAAARQDCVMTKTQTATTVAAQWHTLWDRAGNPGAGSLAIGNTANGLVPDDTTTGAPRINTFGGGATGYINRIQFASTVACRIVLYDRLFHVGSINLNALATTTLSSQPSYVARLPNSDYNGLRIFIEINATVSATATTVAVTYTNQDGTTGRSTGASASLSGFVTGRMVELPLQAGDSGVQRIDSVMVGGTVATTGSVNIVVMRPLASLRVRSANDGDVFGASRLGFKRVYETSCLALMVAADSTSSGVPDLEVQIING